MCFCWEIRKIISELSLLLLLIWSSVPPLDLCYLHIQLLSFLSSDISKVTNISKAYYRNDPSSSVRALFHLSKILSAPVPIHLKFCRLSSDDMKICM